MGQLQGRVVAADRGVDGWLLHGAGMATKGTRELRPSWAKSSWMELGNWQIFY